MKLQILSPIVALAMLATSGLAAFAQYDPNYVDIQNKRPLQGSINLDVDNVRIKRVPRNIPVAPLQSSVSDTQYPSSQLDLQSQTPQFDNVIDPNAFRAAAASFAGGVMNAAAAARTAQLAKPKDAPYIWYQSIYGGYFDGSGTTKEVVPAGRLHLFGGKFADGTPVPKTQIMSVNAAGHAFKQDKLTTDHFWDH